MRSPNWVVLRGDGLDQRAIDETTKWISSCPISGCIVPASTMSRVVCMSRATVAHFCICSASSPEYRSSSGVTPKVLGSHGPARQPVRYQYVCQFGRAMRVRASR